MLTYGKMQHDSGLSNCSQSSCEWPWPLQWIKVKCIYIYQSKTNRRLTVLAMVMFLSVTVCKIITFNRLKKVWIRIFHLQKVGQDYELQYHQLRHLVAICIAHNIVKKNLESNLNRFCSKGTCSMVTCENHYTASVRQSLVTWLAKYVQLYHSWQGACYWFDSLEFIRGLS